MPNALAYAALSDAVYSGPGGPSPAGWTKVLESPVVPGNQGSASGYFGAAYLNDATGEIVVANRGSRLSTEGVWQDWVGSDTKIAGQGLIGIPESFQDARAFADAVRSEHPGKSISYTGHSLGGACAQIQAATTGASATTFGAPGVAFAVSPEQASAASDNITNYVLPGDPVTKAGTHVGQVVPLSTSAGGVAKSIGALAGAAGVAALPSAITFAGPLGLLAMVLGLFAANHPMANYLNALPRKPSSLEAGRPGAGRPAARLTDMHTCPMITVLVPHVGGPISMPGSPNVFIQGLPAARVTDQCVCVGPMDAIVQGSKGVFINGLPAARLGDSTAHGGVIVAGATKVLIGDAG